jgi:hypothetical protein
VQKCIMGSRPMPDFKKLRFKIEGKIDDVDFTPTTMPMARLAEYLADLAQLLGHNESVHLIGVEEGSTAPVLYYDALEEARIFSRVRGAVDGTGHPDAIDAYQRIDQRLKRDSGSARLVNSSAELAEFPGIHQPQPDSYPKIRERGTIAGKLRRVGGKGDTIPIWIERADRKMFYCETSEHLSRELSEFYLRLIRVHGVGTYIRNEDGEWEQTKFAIQSFDPVLLADESIIATFEKLRAIDDNEWNEIKDPLAELRRLRHGENDPIQ